MRYAQTGITGYIPPKSACTGHRYEDRPDRDNPHMSVDCSRCEPFLAADPLWAAGPHQVPLTELEKRTEERQKAETDARASQGMAGLASLFAAVASRPGIIDGLAKLIGAETDRPATPPEPAPDVAAPASGPSATGTTAARPAAKRSSRVRKTPAKAAA